jgi:ribosomal protein L13
MKTPIKKLILRAWYLMDAKDAVLGRLAVNLSAPVK